VNDVVCTDGKGRFGIEIECCCVSAALLIKKKYLMLFCGGISRDIESSISFENIYQL
jgi:hypothetical protein